MARAVTSPRRRIHWFVVLVGLGLAAAGLLTTIGLVAAHRSGNDLGRVAMADHLDVADDRSVVNALLMSFTSASTLGLGDPLRSPALDGQRRAHAALILRVDRSTESVAFMTVPVETVIDGSGPAAGAPVAAVNTLGGPGVATAALREMLDIPIHHYVEIDSEDLSEIIDALGDVQVYVPFPIRSVGTGLNLEVPGCASLDGETVEDYLLTDDGEALVDGAWMPLDTLSSHSTAQRTHDVLSAVLRRANLGISRPFDTASAWTATADSLTVDDLISRRELAELVDDARRFQTNDLRAWVLDAASPTGGAAEEILEVFRTGEVSALAADLSAVPGTAGLRSVTCR